jgi:hypothetical protein
VRRALLLTLLAACHPHAKTVTNKAVEAGVSIAIYERDGAGYSVVDDRRWIDLAGPSVLLANIDPGADLASLVLEPSNPALKIGSCTRDRMPELMSPEGSALEAYARKRAEIEAMDRARLPGAPVPQQPRHQPAGTQASGRYLPVVRCEMTGAPGRYLVRILYVSTTLHYRAQHEVTMTDPTHATVVSRFAVTTPPWRERADVVLFDGVPGGEHPPEEITRGTIDLDGATAVLSVPARDIKSELRRVFDGAVISGDDTRDANWGRESMQTVWVWLELAALHLAPGPVHVHLDLAAEGVHEIDIAPASRKQLDEPGAPLRLPLWVDDDLRGTRNRTLEYNDGNALTERLAISVGNMGETPREVFVEEHLRTAAHRKIERAFPKKPAGAPGEILRSKLQVDPGKVARIGYELDYEF